MLAALTSRRFADKSVTQVWATLLDEGTYLCSQSTMHQILRANALAGERRRRGDPPGDWAGGAFPVDLGSRAADLRPISCRVGCGGVELRLRAHWVAFVVAIAGASYCADALTLILTGRNGSLAQVGFIGEVVLMIWLLWRGARRDADRSVA